MAPTGKRKIKEGKGSESSNTPQSSGPSVDDDEQKLVQHGASSSTRQSGSPTKSTTASQSKGSAYQSLPSTSTSPEAQSTPKKSRLAAPDQGTGAVGSSSPAKKNFLSQLKSKLSPSKRPPNRSTDSECQCHSKTNHKPDCPEFNKREAGAKSKSPKRSNKSKASSSSVSAVISTEEVKGAESSSVSDPSVKESSSNVPKSKQLLEQKLLTVAEQEMVTGSPKSPAKKGFFTQIMQKMSPNKRSNNPSPVPVCRCKNRNDHESECPERRKLEAKDNSPKQSSRSATSSSSASPNVLQRNQGSVASNTSSGTSRRSNSKSSSTSGANVERRPERHLFLEWSPGRKNRASSSKNQKDYDPQEGSSRDSAGRTRTIRLSSAVCTKMITDGIKRLQIGGDTSKGDGESGGEELEPVIENMDDTLSEGEEGNATVKPRKRSKSWVSMFHVAGKCRPRKPHSKAKSKDGSNNDPQRLAVAAGPGPSVKRKAPKFRGDDGSHVDTQRGTEAGLSDSSLRRKDLSVGGKGPKNRQDDGQDDTQMDVEPPWTDKSVRKKEPSVLSKNRKDDGSDTDSSDEADSPVGGEYPRSRQVDRTGDNTQRRSAETRPDSPVGGLQRGPQLSESDILINAGATGPVPAVRRHRSLSPYPLDQCNCGNRYFHQVGCSRERRARERRKRRKCRQDVPPPPRDDGEGR